MSNAFASGHELNPERNAPKLQECAPVILPIEQYRSDIEESLYHNSVSIILGNTGSGKSTQVPAYAAGMTKEDGTPYFDSIKVTQPRIIAARSVSERVQYESLESGTNYKVGYYTGKESSPNPQSQQDIAFLTDGKAAAQLLHSKLEQAANVDTNELWVIDEGHEMNLNIEVLLAVTREVTDPKSKYYNPRIKVVIMSATIDTERLQKYYSHAEPPVIHIPVNTHPIESSVEHRQPAVVAGEIAEKGKEKVLAFFPGKREIKKAGELLAQRRPNLSVIPLHSQQTAKDQKNAFKPFPNGVVVATTPVAETSITVPDATTVVDSGLVRIDRIDYSQVETGSEGLYLEDAPQKNLEQRRGRVGRTSPGKYILASSTKMENRPQYGVPAMERTRLDSMLLGIKSAGHELSDFTFFNEPPKQAINAAHDRLYNLGAINKAGKITERGKMMDKLPLDAEYACMLAYAIENSYGEEVVRNLVDIISIMQLGGIFKRPPKEQRWRELLYTDAGGEVKENESDFFAQLEGYIKLMTINRRDWEKYDIIEYSAELVERERQELARRIGLEVHEPDVVLSHNRHTVLKCINAGQINQLWQKRNDKWELLVGNNKNHYEQADSSIVGSLGRIATGSLFTLGLGHDELHMVQDLNITNQEILKQIAGPQAKDSINKQSIHYDHEKQMLMAMVDRKLGTFVMAGVSEVPIETPPGSPEREFFRDSYIDHVWTEWSEANKFDPKEYNDLDRIRDAISHPEIAVYGLDPFDKTELYAWKCANGKWSTSEEVAVKSLEQRLARLDESSEVNVKFNARALERKLNKCARKGLISRREYTEFKDKVKDESRKHYVELAEELYLRITGVDTKNAE